MKVNIEYDRYEDRHELDVALNGVLKQSIYEEIWDDVFRPFDKYGGHEEMTSDELLNHLVSRFNVCTEKEYLQ